MGPVSIVDNAVYRGGQRIATPATLEETYRLLDRLLAEDPRCAEPGEHRVLVWIGLHRPSDQELDSVARHFDLHSLAVEDIRQAEQRPKLDRYGQTLFTVLRPAVYQDETETVDFGEIHIFTGEHFVITVRHSEHARVGRVRERVESEPRLLSTGAEAVLYAVLDQTVDDYFPVVEGLENDIDEISDALVSATADRDGLVSQRIYQLTREVSAFHRAVAPLHMELHQFLEELGQDGTDLELRHSLRDVLDHLIVVDNKIESFQASLTNALMLDSTLLAARQNEAAIEQNEQMKRISSWAAILFAPSIIGSVYGMNFHRMPELSWTWGYPMSLGLMLLTGVSLYAVFKLKRWL
jgi:magnesium transporter